MAAVTPTLIQQKGRTTTDSNTYAEPGFAAGVSAGTLLLHSIFGVRSVHCRRVGTDQAADDWYTWDFNTDSQGDTSGWATPSVLDTADLASTFAHSAWKIAEGDEDDGQEMLSGYGRTSFGNSPRALWLANFSGVRDPADGVNEVVLSPAAWYEFSTTTTSSVTVASAAPGSVTENSLEIFIGKLVSRNAPPETAESGVTLQWSGSSPSDSDGGFAVWTRVANADGSLDPFTMTVNTGGSDRAMTCRRIVIQGTEPTPPQGTTAALTGGARVTAQASNLSQVRRTAEQARERREHLWVSDVGGVQKVVFR